MSELTDEQCHAFRILPVSFNDMVRAIFEAGRDAQRESDAAMLDSLKMHSAALEIRANKGD